MAKHPSAGMFPFGGPKSAKGTIARGVQGTNGRSKPMHTVAAPSKNSKPVAVKIAEHGTKRPSLAKGPGSRAGNDKVSKPQRVRPL